RGAFFHFAQFTLAGERRRGRSIGIRRPIVSFVFDGLLVAGAGGVRARPLIADRSGTARIGGRAGICVLVEPRAQQLVGVVEDVVGPRESGVTARSISRGRVGV